MFRRTPVRALRDGGYALQLEAVERELLLDLCAELRALVESQDEAVGRLFPAAVRDDPEASAEYDRLVRGELVSGRLEALATVKATIGAERLDEAELAAWCGALNDLRLVLGERLGVTEETYEVGVDADDPRAPELAVFGWLTWLQGSAVEALASRL
jgi:Domain of unknown function (DUF2017)